MDGELTVIKKRFNVALDIFRAASNREFEVVEGDTGNELCVALTADGRAVELTGLRVMAVFSNSRGTACQDSANGGLAIEGNVVTIPLNASSVAPGMVECELQIYSGENLETLVTSAKFNFSCRRCILNYDTIESTAEYPLLIELVHTIQTLKSTIEQAEQTRESNERRRTTNEYGRTLGESERVESEAERTETFNAAMENVAAALSRLEGIGAAELKAVGSEIYWRRIGSEVWSLLVDVKSVQDNFFRGVCGDADAAAVSGLYSYQSGALLVSTSRASASSGYEYRTIQLFIPYAQGESAKYRFGSVNSFSLVPPSSGYEWSSWGALTALSLPAADKTAYPDKTSFSKTESDKRYSNSLMRSVSGAAVSEEDAREGEKLATLRILGVSAVEDSGVRSARSPENPGVLTSSEPTALTVSSSGAQTQYAISAGVLRGLREGACDELDLINGKLYRRIDEVELTGAEEWTHDGYSFVLALPDYSGGAFSNDVLCTHYSSTSWGGTLKGKRGDAGTRMCATDIGGATKLRLVDNVLFPNGEDDIPALKAMLAEQYAAGTPVTLLLAKTSPVITDYADTVDTGESDGTIAMSVNGSAKVLAEYPRDLNKAVAELTNAIISLGGEA